MPPPILRPSLTSIPTSIATVSIGTPATPLAEKLSAISAAWFTSIELGFPDLMSFAATFHNRKVGEAEYGALCEAASEVRMMCRRENLGIMMLQPFANFEGWPREAVNGAGSNGNGNGKSANGANGRERNKAFARAKGWIRIMEALGTEMLQVGSSDSEGISGDERVLAGDLAELADMLAEKGFRVAYENWCWATRAPTWRSVCHLVALANRPNLGLCLDTFQLLGSEYADPTTPSGYAANAPFQSLQASLQASLLELTATIPAEKIYVLQISDAWKPPLPLSRELGRDGLRPKGRWSHDFRPCPFQGGYLSRECVDVTRAVLATGVRSSCYFSIEVFDGGPEGKEDREQDLEKFCRRAKKSLERLLDECAVSSVNGSGRR